MEPPVSSLGQFVHTWKRFARRLFTIGENRLELLLVEVREERQRLGLALVLALGVAAFGLLAAMLLTAAIAVLLWRYSPVAVLLALAGFYGAAAGLLYRRLTGLLHDCKMLSATLDQLRRDRACLEKDLT